MKDKAKEKLLKFVLMTSFIWMILCVITPVVLSYIFSLYIVERIIWVMAIIMLILGGILFIMMCFLKIKIKPSKVKSERYKLQLNGYEEVKCAILQALISSGFSSAIQFSGDESSEGYISTKKGIDSLTVFELVRVKELDEETLEKRTEDFWDYVYSLNMQSRDVLLIQCICVDRITKEFSKFTEQNVPQQFGRYQLPVGISFGGNTVYIATQKGGMFKRKYKHLKRQFIDLMGGNLTAIIS